ncbi:MULTISPECIES: hypothetical protein [unclassified Colwellia]|jgi:hypothetical protein|uniref:hypothetical protein n=1 Tax=unclassified Colwellia TaxID=196834 RepID=UPI0015F66B2D|nr:MULTISPECIES: hypothetical protein [unclassified Colwellia]MBA6232415.1 hypothetical protein [Colwellia sp. MB02u-7]MBA6238272.1 hypothetical protein [Colwellia sp. MB02u-11]MBA6301022.1 hypothetical protein [Colwellia sp. MB3u-22]MBA6310046.1 hypothetical protein [Colwellia sp. MB3u-64]
MNKPDFESYTFDELIEVAQVIDKNSYPERYDEVIALIKKRNSSHERKLTKKTEPVDSEEDESFTEIHAELIRSNPALANNLKGAKQGLLLLLLLIVLLSSLSWIWFGEYWVGMAVFSIIPLWFSFKFYKGYAIAKKIIFNLPSSFQSSINKDTQEKARLMGQGILNERLFFIVLEIYENGIEVSLNPKFKRSFLFISWNDIQMIEYGEYTIGTLARLHVVGLDKEFAIPWSLKFNELVPSNVGLTESNS